LSDFKYLYDDVIFLGLTRYEFGLWFIFFMFFFLEKALGSCGDPKTVFDFMRPAKTKDAKQKIVPEPSSEAMRKLREEALKKKKN